MGGILDESLSEYPIRPVRDGWPIQDNTPSGTNNLFGGLLDGKEQHKYETVIDDATITYILVVPGADRSTIQVLVKSDNCLEVIYRRHESKDIVDTIRINTEHTINLDSIEATVDRGELVIVCEKIVSYYVDVK